MRGLSGRPVVRGAGCRSSLFLRVMRSMGNPCAITAESRGRGGDHRLPVVRESRTTDVSFCTSSPPPPLFLFDLVIQFSTWLLEGAGPGGPRQWPGRRSSTGGAMGRPFLAAVAIFSTSFPRSAWFYDIFQPWIWQYHITTKSPPTSARATGTRAVVLGIETFFAYSYSLQRQRRG